MLNTKMIATSIITAVLLTQSAYAEVDTKAESTDKQAFQKIDKNKDGKVSIDEFSMVAKKGKTPSKKQIKKKKKLFKKLDANKDKKISTIEYSDYQIKQRATKALKNKSKSKNK